MKFFVLLFVSSLAFADVRHEPTREQSRQIIEHNRLVLPPNNPTLKVLRPYAEYEKAKFFLVNDKFPFDSQAAKLGMVKNLPSDIMALILVDDPNQAKAMKDYFASYAPIGASRIRALYIPGGSGFWVRDSLPLPILTGDPSNPMALTGAKYFHGNHPGPTVGSLLKVPFQEHGYYYEGGNFVADSKGNCLAVDHRIDSIGDAIFTGMYGCAQIIRLPYRAGIGHADERVKFLSPEVAVTDEATYVATLQQLGYQVYLLPRPNTSRGTYANALQINGTLFVPSYGEIDDAKAVAIYEALGLKVIPLPSSTLSSHGAGSLHCITMTYPAGTIEALWNSLPQ